MSTLIAYITRHGCTEKAAQLLGEKLEDSVTLVNFKKSALPAIEEFDTIIIGGSIHAGQVQGKLKKIIETNQEILYKKRLGLFLCCMEEGEKAQLQLETAFPAPLRQRATAIGFFGGEFNFEKMNFLEKWIVKKVAKVTEPVSNMKEKNIEEFAAKLNKA